MNALSVLIWDGLDNLFLTSPFE